MQTGQIGRQFRAELEDFTGNWVLDRQYMGMQRLPAKICKRCLGFRRQQRCLGTKAGSVDIITQKGMAD